jgi:hypothetical protein
LKSAAFRLKINCLGGREQTHINPQKSLSGLHFSDPWSYQSHCQLEADFMHVIATCLAD